MDGLILRWFLMHRKNEAGDVGGKGEEMKLIGLIGLVGLLFLSGCASGSISSTPYKVGNCWISHVVQEVAEHKYDLAFCSYSDGTIRWERVAQP